MTEAEKIKSPGYKKHFLDLFSTSNLERIKEGVAAMENRVNEEGRIFLEMLFNALEVKEAMFQMGVTKSLSLDSMLTIFFQKYCSPNVIEAILKFSNKGDFIVDIDQTIVGLIPQN